MACSKQLDLARINLPGQRQPINALLPLQIRTLSTQVMENRDLGFAWFLINSSQQLEFVGWRWRRFDHLSQVVLACGWFNVDCVGTHF